VDSASKEIDSKELAHQREQAREWRAAAWIIVSSMVISTIVALGLLVLLQRP
jgi:hypothetical protein